MRVPSGVEEHSRERGACAACERIAASILGSYGLTPSGKDSPGPKGRRRRISHEGARRSHERRLESAPRPVDRGDPLKGSERAAFRHLRTRAALCGRAVAILDRCLPAPGVHLERVAVPMRCGVRECETCFAAARQEASSRMEGPWQQFVTVTMRQTQCSRSHAWRHASRWISRLMERVQEAVKRGPRICKSWNCRHRREHVQANVKSGKLEYAWALEPHESLWPHWHIAWNADYVCYDWLREAWAEINGFGIQNIRTNKVYTPSGISHYMAEYMSKARYPTWILAILYRRRIWASTIPKRRVWDGGYALVDIVTGEFARSACAGEIPPKCNSSSSAEIPAKYWTCVEAVEGIFSRWEVDPWYQELGSPAAAREAWAESVRREEWALDKRAHLVRLRRIASRCPAPRKSSIMVDVASGVVSGCNKIPAADAPKFRYWGDEIDVGPLQGPRVRQRRCTPWLGIERRAPGQSPDIAD